MTKELEFETLRDATNDDWGVWAHGSLLARIKHGDDVLELNTDGKVYVLRNEGITHSQLIQVVDKPTDEELSVFKKTDKQTGETVWIK